MKAFISEGGAAWKFWLTKTKIYQTTCYYSKTRVAKKLVQRFRIVIILFARCASELPRSWPKTVQIIQIAWPCGDVQYFISLKRVKQRAQKIVIIVVLAASFSSCTVYCTCFRKIMLRASPICSLQFYCFSSKRKNIHCLINFRIVAKESFRILKWKYGLVQKPRYFVALLPVT
jgi:hypothetical protein